MIQGKLGYSTGKYKVKAKFWSNFVTQSEEANLGGAANLKTGQSVRATGVDYGTKLTFHGLDLVAYGYNGWGLGTTGLLFGGIGETTHFNVTTRGSSGYYIQPGYTFHKAFFGYSYGQSVLTADNATDRALAESGPGVRVNSSHIAQFRYAVTKWDNLVAEWTHTRSEEQNGAVGTSDSVALGTIVFF
jgi:hypothetical protein